MHLVQILLPLADNEGRRFGRADYERVRAELLARFGGLTAFTRAPAEGLWTTEHQASVDDIVVFEVMTESLDEAWWRTYRALLERRFRQDTIVVRVQDIRLI